MPISMKMAKRQNLSLNPSKISGQCGRLMCCLSYENDQYDRVKRAQKKASPKPEELSDIRDKMESNTEEAAAKLSDRTQSGGSSRRSRRRKGGGGEGQKREPHVPVQGDRAPSKDVNASNQDATKTDTHTQNSKGSGDAPKKRRRRRRRR